MRKKKRNWLFILILVVFYPFTIGETTEVRQVETTGEIGFTGVYEPIGTPDPTPPGSIVRSPMWPNQKGCSHKQMLLGLLGFSGQECLSSVSYSFYGNKKRNQQKNKLLRKQE